MLGPTPENYTDPLTLTADLLPSWEKRILIGARELKDPSCAVNTDEVRRITDAGRIVWNALQREFGFDYEALKRGEPLKTIERQGGVRSNGFEERYYPTSVGGVLLVLGFSTLDSVVHLAPTTVSLIKYKGGVIPELQ